MMMMIKMISDSMEFVANKQEWMKESDSRVHQAITTIWRTQ